MYTIFTYLFAIVKILRLISRARLSLLSHDENQIKYNDLEVETES